MKIAFILPSGGRSGGIRCTVVAAKGLMRRGHQVRLLVYKAAPLSRARFRRLWLKIRYPGTNGWLSLFKGHIDTFRDLAKCRFERDEIVIGSGTWSCREINKLPTHGIKKVHYVHGEQPWHVEFMKAAWGANAPKIAVASFLAQRVRDVCGQKVLAIIPHGVDTTEYYPSVPEVERNGIGTIFGRGLHKDPETVRSVLRKLHEAFPKTPQYVFGSGHRPKDLPRSRYTRLPSVDKAREIYSRSLVWVLGSCSEGFSVPVLEAMACGCAVVATDCGGPRDIIKDGENGFLAEVGNVDQIVDRVTTLLEDSELRRRMVGESKDTVSRFTWENSVDKLDGLLQSIAGTKL